MQVLILPVPENISSLLQFTIPIPSLYYHKEVGHTQLLIQQLNNYSNHTMAQQPHNGPFNPPQPNEQLHSQTEVNCAFLIMSTSTNIHVQKNKVKKKVLYSRGLSQPTTAPVLCHLPTCCPDDSSTKKFILNAVRATSTL